jgi:hypothetical protein
VGPHRRHVGELQKLNDYRAEIPAVHGKGPRTLASAESPGTIGPEQDKNAALAPKFSCAPAALLVN